MGLLRAQSPIANSYFIAALLGGSLIALLPIEYSSVLIVGGAVVALSIWEPAIGLGAAIVLGPTRAYLAATGRGGLLYDFGQIFFALALAGWLLRGALRREITLPKLQLLIPLSVWIGAGALSLFQAAAWRDGLNEVIKWIEVAFVLIITYSESRRGRLLWIIGAILLSGAVQASVGLWQWQFRGTGPESFEVADGLFRAYGSFEQPNPFGGFLGLIWPVAAGLALMHASIVFQKLHRWRNLLLATCYSLLAGLLLIAIYASASRGAWLGVGAAVATLAMGLPRRLWLGAGLVIGVVGVSAALAATGLLPASVTARLANITDFVNVSDVRGLNINDANFALVERLAHWQAAQNMIDANPWWGVGLGNYVGAYEHYRLINWPNALGHAHNIYLHTWAETGVVGLAAYGGLWLWVVILTFRTLRRSEGIRRGLALGLLGVWAHLLAHHLVDNLHVNNTDLLLGAWLGVLHVIITDGDKAVDPYRHPGA